MGKPLYKKFPAEFKTVRDENGQPTGQISFYASIFGNVDLGGDRVVKGAFTDSLEEWRASGKKIPVVFSHKWDSLFDIVGWADPNDVTEDDIGLHVVATLKTVINPHAAYLWEMIDEKAITEASFAFDVPEGGEVKNPDDGAWDLKKLGLIEVGPCLKGMNPGTGDYPMFAKSRRKLDAAGSYEAQERAIMQAVYAYFAEQGQSYGPAESGDMLAYAEATYPDYVVVCVYRGDGEDYYKFPYSIAGDGTVTLGDPEPVNPEVTYTAKAASYDDGAWSGDAAMAKCHSAADFKKIAFERDNDSDPDTAAHYTLPHHDGPGAPPNKKGVESALGSLNGSRGGKPNVKNPDAARSHLEAHAKAWSDEEKTSETDSGAGDMGGQPNGEQYGGIVEPDYTDKHPKSVGEVTIDITPRWKFVGDDGKEVIVPFKSLEEFTSLKNGYAQEEDDVETKDTDANADATDDDAQDAKSVCPTCKGSGKDPEGGFCADCGGSGTKDLDAIDTDGVATDGDQNEPADPEDPEEPRVAQKDSAGDEDESASAEGKTDEPDGAKVDDLDMLRAKTQAELLAISALLGE